MKTICRLFLFFILIQMFVSNANSQNLKGIPPVTDRKIDESVISLFTFKNPLDLDYRSTSSIKTYSIVESPYFLGFTDLVKYDGKWYISFRMSDGHVPKKFGDIVILESENSENWKLSKVFAQNDYDLRDPKFLVVDNKLKIHFHSTNIRPSYGTIRNDYITLFKKKTGKWEQPRRIQKRPDIKSWFWKINYNNNDKSYYTISYINGLKLQKSLDGISFKEVYTFRGFPSGASEGLIRFHGNTAYALVRTSSVSVLLESPSSNMLNWQIKEQFPLQLGGPDFLIYKDRIIVSGRDHKIGGTMVLFFYNLKTGETSPIIKLPSNAETGYSGMYIEDDVLYISYYNYINSPKIGYHIYLSKVDLNAFLK